MLEFDGDHVHVGETLWTWFIHSLTDFLGIIMLVLNVGSLTTSIKMKPPHMPLEWQFVYHDMGFIFVALVALSYSPLFHSLHLLAIVRKRWVLFPSHFGAWVLLSQRGRGGDQGCIRREGASEAAPVAFR